jgi:cell division ATPase FtsA
MAKTNEHIIPVAVFDISSSSVAGAHTLIPKGSKVADAKVSILASTRIFSEIKEEINIERFVEQTINQLSKVASTLKKADHHQPSYVQVILASPWFVSQTRTIKYNKTTDFVCTEKLIDSLIEKEIQYILEHDMERFGDIGKDALIIEKQISMIKINGYSTVKPFGKKAQSLELFLVVTVSPKSIIERLKNELQKNYGPTPIGFTTSPYATFIASRDFLGADNEFMIIDIGEEITDVAFIKDNLFLYQHSFPVGIYELYRKLAESGIVNTVEAGALIESFSQGKLSVSTTSSTQKALGAFGETWQKAFQEILDSGDVIAKVPSNSYIICDQRFDAFFSNLIKTDVFLQHVSGTTTLDTTTINQEILSSHISSLDPGKIDETIIVASLFASRLL